MISFMKFSIFYTKSSYDLKNRQTNEADFNQNDSERREKENMNSPNEFIASRAKSWSWFI